MGEEQEMTVQEVAKALGLPQSTVYYWASHKFVPARDVAPAHHRRPQYKLLLSDVQAYLDRVRAERQRPQ